MANSSELLSTVEVARMFGVSRWKIATLADLGLLPPPRLIGRYAVYSREDLPAVRAALVKAGRLPPPKYATATVPG
jgi:DNA-binding transcriptional MerR regulator